MQWLFVVSACGGLAVADRWLKILAVQGVERDFGFAQFVLFKNDALVFSWPGSNTLGIWLMVVAIIIVIYILRRMFWQGSTIGVLGSLCILTGAGSNLYDRLHFGYVVDLAYLGRWWPVFNLADLMIGLGVVIIIFLRPRLRATGVDKIKSTQ